MKGDQGTVLPLRTPHSVELASTLACTDPCLAADRLRVGRVGSRARVLPEVVIRRHRGGQSVEQVYKKRRETA